MVICLVLVIRVGESGILPCLLTFNSLIMIFSIFSCICHLYLFFDEISILYEILLLLSCNNVFIPDASSFSNDLFINIFFQFVTCLFNFLSEFPERYNIVAFPSIFLKTRSALLDIESVQ